LSGLSLDSPVNEGLVDSHPPIRIFEIAVPENRALDGRRF
jgi:hypothetical protein